MKEDFVGTLVVLIFVLGFFCLVGANSNNLFGLVTFDSFEFEIGAIEYSAGDSGAINEPISPENNSRLNTRYVNFTYFINKTGGAHNYSGLDDHVVGNWWFEQNTSDVSGNNNDGTVNGNVINTTGIVGGGYEFDGYNDYIQLGNLLENDPQYTISSWIKSDRNQLAGVVVGKGDDGGGNVGEIMLGVGSDNLPYIVFRSYTNVYTTVSGTTPIVLGQWYHLTLVYDNATSNGSLYVNGEIESSLELVGGRKISSLNVGIGHAGNNFNNPTRNFNGTIDEVMIWNRSLSSGEISSLYNRTLNIANVSLLLSIDENYERNKTNSIFEADDLQSNETFNITFDYGQHNIYWKIATRDINDSRQWNSSEYYLFLNSLPLINNQFPLDNSNLNTSYVNFTYNVSDLDSDTIDNCTLWLLKYGVWEENKTNQSGITQTINQTINITLEDGSYSWKIGCYDNVSGQGNSSSYDLTIGTTFYPEVQSELVSPTNNSIINTKYINFTYYINKTGGIHNYSGLNDYVVGNWWFEQNSSDVSSNGNDGTWVNADGDENVSGLVGNAYEFDGVNDYISISIPITGNTNTSADNFAYSAWFKTSNYDKNSAVIGRGNPAEIAIISGTGGIRFLYCGGWSATYNTLVADGNWHHVVGQRVNGYAYLYLDGIQVASYTVQNLNCSGTVARIGSDNYWGFVGETFNGTIDEVMIFNRSLSSGEISALYNNTLNIANVSLLLSVDGNYERNITIIDISSIGANDTINLTFDYGQHNIYWKIALRELNDSKQWNSSEYYLFLNPLPKVSNRFPLDNAGLNTNYINFTYKVDSGDIDNCTLWLLKSGVWEENKTNQSGITQTINQTINITLEDGSYSWKIGCYDNVSEQGNSSFYNITIDLTAPSLDLQFPANDSNISTSNMFFVYNASEDTSEVDTCKLYFGYDTAVVDFINKTDSDIADGNLNYFDINFNNNGTYIYWKIGCNDTANNQINSSINKFYLAAKTRNLLMNSNMLISTVDPLPDYWAGDPYFSQALNTDSNWLEIVDDAPFDGVKSIHLLKPQLYFESAIHKLPKGHNYTFSVYLKANQTNVSAKLHMGNIWGGGNEYDLNITTEWTRFNFSANVTSGHWLGSFLQVFIIIEDLGEVWISAPQLEFGNILTDYEPSNFDKLFDGRWDNISLVDISNPYDIPNATSINLSSSIILDGNLSEEVWINATKVELTDSFTGNQTDQNTTVYFFHDDNNFYVGFEAEETDVAYMRRLSEGMLTDWLSKNEDYVMVTFASDNSSDDYSEYKMDFFGNSTSSGENDGWYGSYPFGVNYTNSSWTAEFRIPLYYRNIFFSEGKMKVNFIRGRKRNVKPYCDTYGLKCDSWLDTYGVSSWSTLYYPYDTPVRYGTITGFDTSLPYYYQIKDINWIMYNDEAYLYATLKSLRNVHSTVNLTAFCVRGETHVETYALKPLESKKIRIHYYDISDIYINWINYLLRENTSHKLVSYMQTGGTIALRTFLDYGFYILTDYDFYTNETEMNVKAYSDVDQNVAFNLTLNDDEGTEIDMGITGNEYTLLAHENFTVNLDISSLANGNYTFTARGYDVTNSSNHFYSNISFRKLVPQPTHEVKVNRFNGALFRNGTGILPFGFLRNWDNDIKNHSFNTVVLLSFTSASQIAARIATLDNLYANGSYAIINVDPTLADAEEIFDAIEDHPAIIGNYYIDEPGLSRAQLMEKYIPGKTYTPYFPTFVNWGGYTKGSGGPGGFDITDIISSDYYPYTIWAPSGSDIDTVSTLTGNMYKDASVKGKPIGFWHQIYSIDDARRSPTPAQMKAMSYVSFIDRVRLFYFWSYKSTSLDLWEELKNISNELQVISPYFISSESFELDYGISNFVIKYTIWDSLLATCLLAVNPLRISLDGSFDVSSIANSGSLDVLFEGRTININNGMINDSFEGYERHVYCDIKEEEAAVPIGVVSEGEPSRGAGGPGGSYIESFDIGPEVLKISQIQGRVGELHLDILNTGSVGMDFNLEISENLKDLIYLLDETEYEFFVPINDAERKTLFVYVPENYEPGVYTGYVSITSGLFVRKALIIIEVKEKEALFDVELRVPLLSRGLYPGSVAEAEIFLKNMGDIMPIDVTLQYFIRDLSGKLITLKEETFAVFNFSRVMKSLRLPKTLAFGDYLFGAKITYGKNQTAVSGDILRVVEKEEFPLVVIFIFLSGLLCVISLIYWRRKVLLLLGSFGVVLERIGRRRVKGYNPSDEIIYFKLLAEKINKKLDRNKLRGIKHNYNKLLILYKDLQSKIKLKEQLELYSIIKNVCDKYSMKILKKSFKK